MVAADEGQFDDLPDLDKYRTMARGQMEREERASDKVASDLHKQVLNNFQARANLGRLTSGEQQALLEGTASQYLTAKEGHALVGINNSPVSGAGSTAAKAIMSSYYLGGARTLPRIQAARRELNALQAQLGEPDPFIMKYANELQSDEDEARRQGISMRANEIAERNRGIQDLKTEYQAEKKDKPKALEKVFWQSGQTQ